MAFILLIITKREEWVPKAVVRYLRIFFLVSLIGFVLGYYLYSRGLVPEKPASLFSDILYYLIWSSYFKKSKRVNGYY